MALAAGALSPRHADNQAPAGITEGPPHEDGKRHADEEQRIDFQRLRQSMVARPVAQMDRFMRGACGWM